MRLKKSFKNIIRTYVNQKCKHFSAVYERRLQKERFNAHRPENFHFKRKGDKPLNDEQKRQIRDFWKKYEFAYKVNPSMAMTSYNRSGIFDPRYIPFDLKKELLVKQVVERKYLHVQKKNFLRKHIPNANLPGTVIAAYYGIYYDQAYNVLSKEEAIAKLAAETGEVVVKPTLTTSGGQGITFMVNPSLEDAQAVFKKMKGNMIIQKAVKQHEMLNRFNQSTVNTVRITSFRRANNEVAIVAALLKVGGGHVRVDNYKHGGCLIGMDMDGKLNNWALGADYSRVTVIPSGVDLEKETFVIPGFSELKKMVEKVHLTIPQVRVVSWDIAIDADAVPTVIEINFNGDWRMHQILTGPVFGEYTEELLDEFLLKKYYRTDSYKAFDIHEYYDHVEIEGYYGYKKNVVVPETIHGKPVTRILNRAFIGSEYMESIVIPSTVTYWGTRAFARCTRLNKISFKGHLKGAGSAIFEKCNKLSVLDVNEDVIKRIKALRIIANKQAAKNK